MGQDIGTTIVKLTGGEGLGLGLEPIEFIQGSSPSLASVYPYTLPGLKVRTCQGCVRSERFSCSATCAGDGVQVWGEESR